ncbi:MAG: hypothetical protein IT285_08380 [Bdellovibrionales bacterium]|nr:hypothetical protein [Bdellovibrionales bacterium]
MAAEEKPAPERKRSVPAGGDAGESGQSILEFLLMVPLMIGLSTLMVRVNTVIQVSIANQKYARAQAFFLTYNSPYYPELRLRQRLVNQESNEMIIGVSDKIAPKSEDQAEYDPDPIIVPIVSASSLAGESQEPELPPEGGKRGRVRVRTTVTLCTQVNVVETGDGFVPYDGSSMLTETPVAGQVTFPFCRGVFSE